MSAEQNMEETIDDMEESSDDPQTLQSFGQKCEVKTLYKTKSTCDCCISWVDRKPATDDPQKHRQVKEEHDGFALLKRKQPHGSSGWITHSVVINSPHIKARLAPIFQDYQGVNPYAVDLEFEAPFIPLLHRREEIFQAERDETDGLARQHLALLRNFLKLELADSERFLNQFKSTHLLEFQQIPLVFIPGEVIIQNKDGRVSAAILMQVSKSEFYYPQRYELRVRYLQWNGKKCGYTTTRWEIDYFQGSQKLNDMPIFPLRIAPNRTGIEASLIDRGRKFHELCGQHLRQFAGIMRVKEEGERVTTAKFLHVSILLSPVLCYN